jgi:uncharacterized protein YegP (UPF0339 family)
MKPAKIVLWQSTRDRAWRIRIKAANGRIVLDSEAYSSWRAAARSALRLMGQTGWVVQDPKGQF